MTIFVLAPIFKKVEDRENFAIWILFKMPEDSDITPIPNFFREICGVKNKLWLEKCIVFAGS